MDEDLKTISLEELAEGAAGERWAHEFERLLDNCLDPNRDAEAKRTIVLKIEVEPNEKRNGGRMSIHRQDPGARPGGRRDPHAGAQGADVLHELAPSHSR